MIEVKITAYEVLTTIGEIRQLTSSMRRAVKGLLGVADLGRLMTCRSNWRSACSTITATTRNPPH